MKKAIDTNGIEVDVSDDVVVNTVNGIHYLLTLDEQISYNIIQNEWAANSNNRALESLRLRRNILLNESDWTDLPSTPLANKDTWQIYRQSLRDLPETYINNAAEVIWPIKPE